MTELPSNKEAPELDPERAERESIESELEEILTDFEFCEAGELNIPIAEQFESLSDKEQEGLRDEYYGRVEAMYDKLANNSMPTEGLGEEERAALQARRERYFVRVEEVIGLPERTDVVTFACMNLAKAVLQWRRGLFELSQENVYAAFYQVKNINPESKARYLLRRVMLRIEAQTGIDSTSFGVEG